MISQPREYRSLSTRNDWGMIVPTFIMMVPAFMVPDNRHIPQVAFWIQPIQFSRSDQAIKDSSAFAPGIE
jgi:hypothetical protein